MSFKKKNKQMTFVDLESVENNDFSKLPILVYVKGFLKNGGTIYGRERVQAKYFLRNITENPSVFTNEECDPNDPNDPMGTLIATSGKDYCLVYAPTGKEILIDVSKFGFELTRSQGYNPQNGDYSQAKRISSDDIYNYDPPGEIQRGNDWVLVLKGK